MATSKRPQESEKNSRESKLIPVLDKSNVLSYSHLLVRHKLVPEVCDLFEVLFREIPIPMMRGPSLNSRIWIIWMSIPLRIN